jgi:trimeric autotransporter adhesin
MKRAYSLSWTMVLFCFILTSCNIETVKDASKNLSIEYEQDGVIVHNPMAEFGVTIRVQGTDVLVNSTYSGKDIVLNVKGRCTDGSLKIYSNKSFKLQLDGLELTNEDGPAINIQGRKDNYIEVVEGSSNMVTDGINYSAEVLVSGISEDQGAAFCSEGSLIFQGSGVLTIYARGLNQHAISSDDEVRIENACINIASSCKDGIHTNDGFIQQGGSLAVSSSGDAIDVGSSFVDISAGTITLQCDSTGADGIVADSTITVSGGSLDIETIGAQSKGLKSGNNIRLTGGQIHISGSGGVVFTALASGFDPSYASGIKSEGDVLIDGVELTIIQSGAGSKCISSGNDVTMLSGTVTLTSSGDGDLYVNELGDTEAFSSACISSDGPVNILGGSLTTTSTGVGGKGITCDGVLTIGTAESAPAVEMSTSGESVMRMTTSMAEAKVLKSDADIYICNGTVLLDASGMGEAIDTQSSLYISGGLLVAQGTQNGSGVKTLDFETDFCITGGTVMVSSPYRLTPVTPSDATTQNYIFAKPFISTTYVPSESCVALLDSTSSLQFAYIPKRNASSFLYSSPVLKIGMKYKFYEGGVQPNTSDQNGLFVDGVYSPGVLKWTNSLNSTRTVFSFQP